VAGFHPASSNSSLEQRISAIEERLALLGFSSAPDDPMTHGAPTISERVNHVESAIATLSQRQQSDTKRN